MNKILIGLSLFCSLFANSQEIETTQEKKNLVKMNLTSVVFRNYQFAYERLFTKRFSVQVSYGFIPAGQIPFVDEVIKDENVENIKLGGNNLTIEPRFYLGKGYGHGFYIAPYYRYSHFNVDNLTYRYTSEDPAFDGEKIPVSFTGKTNSNNIGLMIGAQWLLGRKDNWVLDVWFIGGHYGGASGTITGRSARPLTAYEQQQLRDDIADLDISLFKYDVTTNSSGAVIKLDSDWLGVRSGISFGYRF
ncbi:DUF3575 domain-containing protein [Chryseobacterium sp. FH1]|uniref:DUF3575 domain-containing protein n=1 Tax=Chryseobacterium sp. FH1 TaxID=1233951 RepID=UPI0004E2BBDF|nr:DUF3575 domain-containing protein [Chryseobacterium sp. FH1]KFC24540.1 hypothetical protein IO90_04430 [Chryseobacterium sp. FH1]